MIFLWIYLAIAAVVTLHRAAAITHNWQDYQRRIGLMIAELDDPELEVVFRAVFKGRVRYCLIMGFAWPIIAVATILRGGRA